MAAEIDRESYRIASKRGALPRPNWSWIEIALAIWSLANAFWQLLLIDRTMIGFALCWMAPPLIMISLRIKGRRDGAGRIWATAYLSLMSVMTLMAEQTAILPNFRAIHQGGTDFAAKWNKLDTISRRVISINMSLGGALLFAWIGYAVFWVEIQRRNGKRPGAPRLSQITCIAGLLVTWVFPAIALTVLAMQVVTQ